MNSKLTFVFSGQRWEIRRLKLKSWDELLRRLSDSNVKDFADVILQYEDLEGDWITFDSPEEFGHCLEMYRGEEKLCRIRVLDKKKAGKIREKLRQRSRCRGFRKSGHPIPMCHSVPMLLKKLGWVFHALGKKKNKQCGPCTRGPCTRPRFCCPGGGGRRPMCPRRRPERAHFGVRCDGCGKSNWVGQRHKCQTCPNYDLCGACLHRNGGDGGVIKGAVHDPTHQFSAVAPRQRCGRFVHRGRRGGRKMGGCPRQQVVGQPWWLKVLGMLKRGVEGVPSESPKKPAEDTVDVQPPAPFEVPSEPEEEPKEEELLPPVLLDDDEDGEEEGEVEDGKREDEPQQSKPEEAHPFATALELLKAMGFDDEKTNVALLERLRGNLQGVVAALLG